ncbi:MAG: protein kinase [Planctomycetota bacterium]
MPFDFEASSDFEQRLRRARAEVERRVREGEVDVAEKLLAATPQIDGDYAIELIYTEFVVLEELGAQPSVQQTLARYPQWQDQLERLLKVHHALADDDDFDVTASADTLVSEPHASQMSTRDGQPTAEGDVGPSMIGQYELLEEIGRGGMGLVYRARQRGLNRIVAVKLIRSATSATPAERTRFRIEAEAAATLQHPNIVQIYEVGRHRGCDFLSMEYVSGGNLEHQLRKEGGYSVRDAATLIATLAEAMHAAHEHGIIHRDLKPGNILLSGDTPKISDFGLAKLVSGSPLNQTQSGALLGTPCYMSPEQAAGRNSDTSAATDIYALGAILYELLVDRPPLMGETTLETLDLIRHREPERPSVYDAKLPRDLETICLKCLAKEPRSRYASAKALADDLHRFLQHEPIQARPVGFVERGWRWVRRRPGPVGLMVLLLIVSVVSAYALTRQSRYVGELSRSAAISQQKADEVERQAEQAFAEADRTRREATEAIDRLSLLGARLHVQPGMGETAVQTAEQAAAQYASLLEQHGDDEAVRCQAAQSYERIGYIHLEKGHPELAADFLQQAIDLQDADPTTSQGRLQLAGTEIALGHAQRNLEAWAASAVAYQTAIDILESLCADHPGNGNYEMTLANTLANATIALRREGRFEEAFWNYIRSMRLIRGQMERQLAGPDFLTVTDADEDSALATAFMEVQRSTEIFAAMQSASASIQMMAAKRHLFTELALTIDDMSQAFENTAPPHEADKAIRLALDLRQVALDLIPGEHWRKQLLARSHRRLADHQWRTGDFEAAIDSYNSAVTLYSELMEAFPERIPFRINVARLRLILGMAQRERQLEDASRENMQQSVAILEQLIDDDSISPASKVNLADSLHQLGQAYTELGRLPDAVRALQKSLAANPAATDVMNRLAWLQLTADDQSVRDAENALQLAETAVEAAERNHLYWNTLGVAYYRNDQFAEAVSALLQSMELHPQDGTAFDWYVLAMAHLQLGEWDAADEYRERASSWHDAQPWVNPALVRFREECDALFESRRPS